MIVRHEAFLYQFTNLIIIVVMQDLLEFKIFQMMLLLTAGGTQLMLWNNSSILSFKGQKLY